MAERTGLEPATPGVTGRYSNQLNYRSELDGAPGKPGRGRILMTAGGGIKVFPAPPRFARSPRQGPEAPPWGRACRNHPPGPPRDPL